jgi:hypothetical protein
VGPVRLLREQKFPIAGHRVFGGKRAAGANGLVPDRLAQASRRPASPMLMRLKIEHIGKDIFEWKTNLDVKRS